MGNFAPIVSQWFYKAAHTADTSYFVTYGLLSAAPTAAVSYGVTMLCGLNASIIGG